MRKSFNFLLTTGLCAALGIVASAQSIDAGKVTVDESTAVSDPGTPGDGATLSGPELRAKLADARKLLSSGSDFDSGKLVRLAVLDPKDNNLQLVTLEKDSFLTKDATVSATSEAGRAIDIKIVRANGVNTAVTAKDASSGRLLMPLMVAYPIVRSGSVTEIAYYASAHPALLSSELTSDGQSYVRTMLDKAAENLATKGVEVPSDIVDVAEHLCVVEHTDHRRFMTEEHSELFPEILALYALNEGDTYKYSVSTAGAGGMIQMIPKTYQGIREHYSTVPLQSDFVKGMRDHGNALEAMLLYMNDTWKRLEESPEVQTALQQGVATKPELLAAGYNSNPVRLPMYLKDGGANWRTLIPAETQMYLSIYREVDRNLKEDQPSANSSAASEPGAVQSPSSPGLLSWLGTRLLEGSAALIQLIG